MSKHSYDSRLCVPIEGLPNCPLFTKTGMMVARGYLRIVIGGRGPYVEFDDSQLVMSSLIRARVPHYYYDEWRTTDVSNVKFYQQMATVGYADYLVGMWYASPSALCNSSGVVLLDSMIRKPVSNPEESPSIFG